MSKYCYGKIEGDGWFVRLAEWKLYMNEKNELSPYVKILKKFKTKKECIDYITEMKKKDKGDNNGKL